MNEHPAESKALLRRRMREALQGVSPEERASASAGICQRLRAQSIWLEAEAVLVFFPVAGEPDIWPLALEALAAGKIVCLPRAQAPPATYAVCQIQNPERDLEPGPFDIRQPTAACPTFSVKQLDLALVPGIGFSLIGGRLGRGKGFYDRLLTGLSGFKCGVAFDFQAALDVPLEPHDVRLDGIVTPTRWHKVAQS